MNVEEKMKHIEVVAAIIERDGQYFATQRGYGEFKGGWEFPGGKIEAGESKEEALKREIREELDTQIEIKKHLCTVQYQYETFHLTMHCYICHIVSGELKLIEHQDAKWLSKETIDSVEWLPADIEVIEVLKNIDNIEE